jgi:hypothetical protein
VQAEAFAHQAAGAAAGDGAANLLARHDPEAAGLAGRARQHIGDEAAADQTPSFRLGAGEFAPRFQAAGTGKEQARRRLSGHASQTGVKRWRPTRRRLRQSGAAAFAGIAIQEAMLAFAPDFRRLILTFHFIIRFKSK